MPPGWDGVERRGTQPSYIRGGSAPRPNPLTFYVPLFDRKSTPSMLYWYPFHAPSKNTASLFTIVNAPSFHDKTPNQEEYSGGDPGEGPGFVLFTA